MRQILRGIFGFGLGTAFSRLTGLLREIIFAYLYGASYEMDAFRVAFKIPNIIRDLIAEGTVIPAFTPIFAEKEKKGKNEAFKFSSDVFFSLMIVGIIISIIGITFSPQIVKLVAFGFTKEPHKFSLSVRLTQIIFPFLIIVILISVLMGILNYYKKFFITGVAPCFFNFGIILFGFLFFSLIRIYGIAIGVLFGTFLYFLFLLFFSMKLGFRFSSPHLFSEDVKKVLVSILFIAGAYFVRRIGSVIETLIASFLPTGSISYLEYAFRLMHLPVAIIGVAAFNVTLPLASQKLAVKDYLNFKKIIKKSLILTLIFSILFGVVWYFSSSFLCRILYQRGAFTQTDTFYTSLCLKMYSIGIPAICLSRVIFSVFYAMKKLKIPLLINAICVPFFALLAFILSKKMGASGIALASSITSYLNLLLAYFQMVLSFKS